MNQNLNSIIVGVKLKAGPVKFDIILVIVEEFIHSVQENNILYYLGESWEEWGILGRNPKREYERFLCLVGKGKSELR